MHSPSNGVHICSLVKSHWFIHWMHNVSQIEKTVMSLFVPTCLLDGIDVRPITAKLEMQVDQIADNGIRNAIKQFLKAYQSGSRQKSNIFKLYYYYISTNIFQVCENLCIS